MSSVMLLIVAMDTTQLLLLCALKEVEWTNKQDDIGWLQTCFNQFVAPHYKPT